MKNSFAATTAAKVVRFSKGEKFRSIYLCILTFTFLKAYGVEMCKIELSKANLNKLITQNFFAHFFLTRGC